MPETIALARLAISKNRTLIVLLILWALLSVTIAAAVTAIFPGFDPLPVLIILLMPAAAVSLGMFDLGSSQDLMGCESGYNHWLFRMPIANWKLAIVPIALRTVWISTAWYLFTLATRQLSGIQLPTWSAAALFSAMGAWVSVVTWRPFRSGRWRLAAMFAAGLLLYALMLLIFLAHFDSREISSLLTPAGKTLISVSGLVAFAIGVSRALSAVELARTSSDGLIPAMASRVTATPSVPVQPAEACELPVRSYSGPRWALVGHDLGRLLMTYRRMAIAFGALYVVAISVTLPLMWETLAFVIIFSAYLGAATAIGCLEQPKKHESSLPSYVAGSPLTSAEIGFTRAALVTAISSIGLLAVAVIVAGWAFWPENRSTLMRWMEQTSIEYGSPLAAFRIIAATLIAAIAFVPTRSIVHTAAILTGSTRLQLLATIIPAALFLVCVGLVTFWMLQQTDWESAIANAWYWASWLPTVGMIVLVIKLSFAMIASSVTLRHQLVTPQTTLLIVGGWAVASFLVSLSLFWLIPDQRVLFWWSLLAVAVLMPLAHVLILPYAVYLNRHR